MRPLILLVRVLCISVMLVVTASTAQDERSADDSPAAAASLAFYAGLVKETELRRRVNVLYPNPQSIFNGLQVGYVSVRHGNLTFGRREVAKTGGVVAKSISLQPRGYRSEQ